MNRFDTGNAAYRCSDYSLGANIGGGYVPIPSPNSNLGDHLTKNEIGQGTVTAAPVVLERAPGAPRQSFFSRLCACFTLKGQNEQATQRDASQAAKAAIRKTYTPAEKVALREMIHENYGGDEAVLSRFDQLQPQKVSSYQFWSSKRTSEGNQNAKLSEVSYSHEDLRRFLDAPEQRKALQGMVSKTLHELSMNEGSDRQSADYKNANKAASHMEEFLNQGDLASAHRAALAVRGFARSAMNANKYEAATAKAAALSSTPK
jgi:hypothetical protein